MCGGARARRGASREWSKLECTRRQTCAPASTRRCQMGTLATPPSALRWWPKRKTSCPAHSTTSRIRSPLPMPG
uniref:Uncharacterized protein n=1 Tax=Arundo donax TaxID=35708 RepID=A0A0A9EXZ2_ARUDO